MAFSCTAAAMAPSFSLASPSWLYTAAVRACETPGFYLPSLSSALLVQKDGLRTGKSFKMARVVALSSSYGIPGYGAPRPYQTPSADIDRSPSSAAGNLRFGDVTRPDFWNYGAPSDYAAPVNYQAPKGYSAPSAYGPGAAGKTELGAEGATLDEVKEAAEGSGNGGGGRGDDNGGSGGGRGDGNGGEGADGEGAGGKKKGMSMSQKLTLAYAVLVGVGGLIGFAKSGSSKSLMAGGGSASILYYVFLNLPSNPVLASTIGLGISALLLFVMGSRYMESGKVFPAGVVSLFSLVMAGGYIHGIMRTSHS